MTYELFLVKLRTFDFYQLLIVNVLYRFGDLRLLTLTLLTLLQSHGNFIQINIVLINRRFRSERQ